MCVRKNAMLDWENQTVFKDVVLGYINVPKAVVDKLIDHKIFQRLQDVAQTGMETLYPGATHNRFCHSVGVYHLAKMAFRCFQKNVQRQHGAEIYEQVAGNHASCERVWNRWCFLFETAALLHDCGHSPLSHSLEFLYDVNYPAKSCDRLLYDLFQGSPNFQDNFYRRKKGETGQDLQKACGAPHERMSAYFLVHQDGYRAALGELIRDQLLHFDAVHPELEGAAPEYGEAAFFSDLEFMVRAIIGCPYDEDSHFWGEEEAHRETVYQLRNCIINLLHGTIDVDNIDYSIRDASSSGYKSAQVDYERLLKAETIALSYDHREEGLALRQEPFDHSLLLTSFVSDQVEDGKLELVLSGSATLLVEWDGDGEESQAGFSVTGVMLEDGENFGDREYQRVLHLQPGSSAHLLLCSGVLRITPRDSDEEEGAQVYIRSEKLSGVIHGFVFTGNRPAQSPGGGGEDLDTRIRRGKLRISPALHKSALSVIQGALDATNFESRWIYSHHVTTYNNNFLSVFLLEMCAEYYFEKSYENLLKRLDQILMAYPRFLGGPAGSVNPQIVGLQLARAKKELNTVCRKLESGVDDYPDLKNPELPDTLPHFSSTSNLEIYSLLLEAVCKLCRPMPLSENESEFHQRMRNRPCATLVEIVRALRRLPTEFRQRKPPQPWEREAFDENRRWVVEFNDCTMGMETMKALLGMPEWQVINGQRFFRTSDSTLRSMYHNLEQNATEEDRENHRDLMAAIHQAESRRYLKTMWKSHAEFHFYIHGWKRSWLEREEGALSLVQRLFNVQDAPQDPKNGDILYVYFSDEYVKRYGQANQLWAEIKKNFHLDILAYVPQKIRHKELRGDRTYVVWKNRIVTLSDIDIRSGSAPGEQYFYLYYQMSEEGEELDVCAFMDFLRERLIQLESGKPSSNDYANTTPVAKETSPKPGETAGDHKTEDHL